MKTKIGAAVAAIATACLSVSLSAQQPDRRDQPGQGRSDVRSGVGMDHQAGRMGHDDNRAMRDGARHHRHCRTVWYHHHRVQRCG